VALGAVRVRRSGAPPASRLRASVAASLAGKAAEMVTLVLLATVVPRALGPEDYGRFAVPLTIVTLGSLAMTLGGPTLMARYVPAAPECDRVALARSLCARLARGRGLQVAGIALVAVVAATWDPAHFPAAETALVVAALAINVATSVALQVTLGLGRAGPWSARFPLQNAVLVVAVLVLHGAYGSTGAVVALVVAAVAAAVLAAVAVAPIVRAEVPPVPVPDGAMRFGALHATGAALVQFAHRGGVVAVALLAGSTVETGYAALAIGIALGATYAVLQTFTVALPHLAGHQSSATTVDPVPPEAARVLASPPARAVHQGRQNGSGGRVAGAVAGVQRVLASPSAARVPEGRQNDSGRPAPVGAEATLRWLAGALLAVIAPAALVGVALLDTLVPAVFGDDYAGATAAFGPALAVVVLAPLSSLLVQAAALRLQPEVALASGVATAAGFVVGALVMVPVWGSAGATGAALAGVAAGIVVSARKLPAAAGARLVGATFAAATAVLALAVVAA
jgi:O-antigen/teichoic acid export membrane protein